MEISREKVLKMIVEGEKVILDLEHLLKTKREEVDGLKQLICEDKEIEIVTETVHHYSDTDLKHRAIYLDYMEGMELESVASKYHMAVTSVCRVCRKYIDGLMNDRVFSQKESDILDMVDAHSTLEDISKAYDVDNETIMNTIFDSEDVPKRRRKILKYIKVLKDFESGMHSNELSEKYKMNPQTIETVCKYGIDWN